MINKDAAIQIFNEAVKAVQPGRLVPAHVKFENGALVTGGCHYYLKDYNGVYVLCVGKAAAAMAQEAEKILGTNITNGLVVTKHGHALPLRHCRTIEAGHPVPDGHSMAAAHAILGFLQPLTNCSLLLCFISGGASALIADVADGITLQDMQALSALLLACGANIYELNTVRKHVSYLKGGQLVKHANGATVFSFIISDVPGDDMGIIAGGLTVESPYTFSDAWHVLDKYGLVEKIPASIKARILNGMHNLAAEKTADELTQPGNVHNVVIGNNNLALQAAEAEAGRLGFKTVHAGDILHGEAKIAAANFVELLLQYKGTTPACLLAGGETTVTIKGSGKGGRNQEFVLAALCELMARDVPASRWPVILSGGTDGTDGPTEAAGAAVDINIFSHIKKTAINPEKYLSNNDSFHFFKCFDALITTGPTQTNVMDIIIGLIV